MTPNQLSQAYTVPYCQHCPRPVILPGQTPWDLLWELGEQAGIGLTYDILMHPRRYQMRVVYLDRNPNNQALKNLKVLCLPCALRFYALRRRRPVHRRRYPPLRGV